MSSIIDILNRQKFCWLLPVLIFFKCIKIIWRKKTKVENEYPKKVSAFTIICPNSYDRVAEICTALMAVRGYDFPRSLTMKRSRKEGRSFLMTTYQSEKSSFPCYAHFPWHNGAKKKSEFTFEYICIHNFTIFYLWYVLSVLHLQKIRKYLVKLNEYSHTTCTGF